MSVSYMFGNYLKKEEAENMIKEDNDWKKIDTFKITDVSLRSFTNIVTDMDQININRTCDNLEVVIKDKEKSQNLVDIQGCYLRDIEENLFLKTRFKLLIPNYKNSFSNDYSYLTGFTVKKTPFIVAGVGIVSLFSLYKFKKFPFK